VRPLVSSRPRSLLFLVAVVVAPLLTVVSTAAAAGTVSLSTSSVGVAPDFASQRYADQWDYSNPEDLSLVPGFNGSGSSGMSYPGDGTVRATVARGGWLNLVSAIPGSVFYGRDGGAIPIDAGQYTRFSIRMWSDRDNVAQVWWRTCTEANTACYGALQFPTKAGWGTYDVALRKIPQTSAEWAGPILGLQINPTGIADGRIAIDWTRLYQPTAPARVQLAQAGAGSAGDLVISSDLDPNNATTLRVDSSTVRVAANGTVTVDASMLPAGNWYMGVRADSIGTVTYARTPLTVADTPMPVVLDPDISGGADVHEVMGGSAWDFNEMSDVKALTNVQNASVSGGVLRGQNGLPDNWDPQVDLTMPGLIDGSRFHRLTVKIGFDGRWGLENAPGGGMVSRLIWQTNGNPAAYQDLNDIVVMPGDQTISLDLATNPSAAVVDADTRTKIGWAGQLISSLRFDPEEDPSQARTWRIDDIRLAEDDRGAGSFAVKYKDNNWAPGTVADIYVDRGAPGQNRTAVASGIAVDQGVNQFSWSLAGLPAGTYWVLVGMRRGAVSSSAFSTGPVQMAGSTTAASPAPRAVAPASVPFGNLDGVSQVGSDGVRLSGWAIDPALGAAAAPVHLYVDGRAVVTQANQGRSDVGSAFGQGDYHGFNGVVTGIGVGGHTACAYAYRAAGSTLLGCRQITVSGDTIGHLDAVLPTNGGVRVDGWTLDRSTASPGAAHVYVDGRFAGAATASQLRGDVAGAFPEYGAGHGFSFAVPAGAGVHNVCVYGIDQVGPGANVLLGCSSVTVASAPFGALDAASRNGNRVDVSGWALDPQSLSPSAVHVYVDGVGAAVLAADSRRADVMAAFPGYYTSAQGFRTQISVGAGGHTVCAYGVGSGGGSLLGCRRI
ncbi:MAG: hypothetical protein ABIR83_13260, partial [Nakamurella sp.]